MGNCRLAGRDVDLILDAIGLPAETRHFIELAKAGEATPLSPVADDLVAWASGVNSLTTGWGSMSPLALAAPLASRAAVCSLVMSCMGLAFVGSERSQRTLPLEASGPVLTFCPSARPGVAQVTGEGDHPPAGPSPKDGDTP